MDGLGPAIHGEDWEYAGSFGLCDKPRGCVGAYLIEAGALFELFAFYYPDGGVRLRSLSPVVSRRHGYARARSAPTR